MVLDEKRKHAKRNAFLPFILHTKKETNNHHKDAKGDKDEVEQIKEEALSICNCDCDQSSRLYKDTKNSCFKTNTTTITYFLTAYGKILSNLLVQIAVIVFTIFLLIVSIYGNIQLKQIFDPYIFLPHNSSIKTWIDLHKSAFPTKGELVTIFLEGPPGDEIGSLQNMNLSKFEWLDNELRNQSDIVTSVDFWYTEYKEYYRKNFQDYEYNGRSLLELDFDSFNKTLVQFLFSQSGIRYKYLFDFKDELECGGPLPHIQVHIIFLTHVVINDSLKGNYY